MPIAGIQKKPTPKCLTNGCGAPPFKGGRGLCIKCWGSAKKSVEAGTTSWDELARLGMVQSECEDPFLSELERKRRENVQ